MKIKTGKIYKLFLKGDCTKFLIFFEFLEGILIPIDVYTAKYYSNIHFRNREELYDVVQKMRQENNDVLRLKYVCEMDDISDDVTELISDFEH